jgi:hypothetical protein
MSENIVDVMANRYGITEDQARGILTVFVLDQQARRVTIPRQVRAGGQRPPVTPPGEQERPPARRVDPWWYVTNTWQILEPTVAWPLGIYQMTKMGMAANAGINVKAALPKRLGGQSAAALWKANRSTEEALRLQRLYGANRSGGRTATGRLARFFGARGVTAPKPAAGKPPTITKGPGKIGGVPPNVLSVGSWMPSAGILGSLLQVLGPTPTAQPTAEGECPPGTTFFPGNPDCTDPGPIPAGCYATRPICRAGPA